MIKSLTSFAAAGAVALATLATPAPAEAGSRSGAVAAGVVGGLAAGAIIGSAVNSNRHYGYGYEPAPAYYGGPYAYSRCYVTRERVWTNHGPRWRKVRVC
jgi:hypothetical protein